ncbi:type IV secretion system protein TraC, partial [Bacillus wiedmannii]
WQVKPGYIQVSGSDAKQRPFSSRMVSLNLDRNPQEHHLWQNGDILADLTSPTNGIPCPFVFSIVLITEDQAKSQGEATREFLALDTRVNTSYAKYIPNT